MAWSRGYASHAQRYAKREKAIWFGGRARTYFPTMAEGFIVALCNMTANYMDAFVCILYILLFSHWPWLCVRNSFDRNSQRLPDILHFF